MRTSHGEIRWRLCVGVVGMFHFCLRFAGPGKGDAGTSAMQLRIPLKGIYSGMECGVSVFPMHNLINISIVLFVAPHTTSACKSQAGNSTFPYHMHGILQ
jgi:hypothetical protein